MDGYLPYPGRIRILHVDDEPVDLEITRKFLKGEGNGVFEISSVLSAEKALAKLERGRFEVIISDYKMPEMDGIKLFEEVRRMGCGIPFIFFSGTTEPEIIEGALNKGADRYILKTLNLRDQYKELAHAIRDLVAK